MTQVLTVVYEGRRVDIPILKFDEELHPRGDGGKFTDKGGSDGEQVSKMSDERQVQLTELGKKPVTLTGPHIKSDLPHIDYTINQITHAGGKVTNVEVIPRRLYFKEENRPIADHIKEIHTNAYKYAEGLKVGDPYTHRRLPDEYHRDMGRSLGYSEPEIEDFIRRQHEQDKER